MVECCRFITSGIGIEAMQFQNFSDASQAILAFDVNHEINQIADLALHGLVGNVHIRAERQSGQT